MQTQSSLDHVVCCRSQSVTSNMWLKAVECFELVSDSVFVSV